MPDMTDAEFNAACEELYQKGLPRPEWVVGVGRTRYRLALKDGRYEVAYLRQCDVTGAYYWLPDHYPPQHEAACLGAEHIRKRGEKRHLCPVPIHTGSNDERMFVIVRGAWSDIAVNATQPLPYYPALIKMGEILVSETTNDKSQMTHGGSDA